MKKSIGFLSVPMWGLAGLVSLSSVLAAAVLPHSVIKANGYLSGGFFHTLALIFLARFVPVLKILSIGMAAILTGVLVVPKMRKKAIPAITEKMLRSLKYRIPVLVFLVLFGGICLLAVLPRWKRGPNVVLIVVDTLRSDHTALSANDPGLTPSLKNQLMADGIAFPNAFSNSNWTLPSVTSLMTSRYPSEIQITQLTSVLDDRYVTLAEVLKEYGYHTGGVVSHMLVGKSYGLAQGFDWYNEENITDAYGNHHSISSPGVTGKAIDFIRKKRDKKFFLFLHYFDPHYIYIDHEKSLDYSGPFKSGDYRNLRNLVREGKCTPEDLSYLLGCYKSEIRFTDSYIGQVLDELKHQGIYNETIVVFTADHGEEFLEHGWLGHSTQLFNQQIHVPMVIKPAHLKNLVIPDVNRRVVSNLDILPTLMGLLKIEKAIPVQGRNLLVPETERGAVFSEVTQTQFKDRIDQVGVVTDGWKMIKDLTDGSYRLFNRRMDPLEKDNRIHEKESAEMNLKMKLAKWIKDYRQRRKGRNRKKLSDEEIRRLENLGYL